MLPHASVALNEVIHPILFIYFRFPCSRKADVTLYSPGWLDANSNRNPKICNYLEVESFSSCQFSCSYMTKSLQLSQLQDNSVLLVVIQGAVGISIFIFSQDIAPFQRHASCCYFHLPSLFCTNYISGPGGGGTRMVQSVFHKCKIQVWHSNEYFAHISKGCFPKPNIIYSIPATYGRSFLVQSVSSCCDRLHF